MTSAQCRSLAALYQIGRYRVARQLIADSPPVTIIGLTERDAELVSASAKIAGRWATIHRRPSSAAAWGTGRSCCVTVR